VAEQTVRVRGLRELNRAFKQVDADLRKELRRELREAGALVADEARSLFEPVDPASAAGYKVRVRQRGVAVEQSRRRTTGLHPEFGLLQMDRALLPALDDKQDEVVAKVEDILDHVGDAAGF